MFPKLLRSNVGYVQAMSKIIFVLYVLTYLVDGEPATATQSTLKYSNPKYLKDIQVTSYRRKRNDPYSTNITATTYHAWGSNVSFLVTYPVEDGTMFKMRARLCDLADKFWVVEILRLHSNITNCPQGPGTYGFYNLVVLPKALPAAVPTSKKSNTGVVNLSYYITATKERIFDVQLVLKVK